MRRASYRSGLFAGAFFFISIVFGACSINYREGQLVEDLEDTVPNIRMTGLVYRLATKDRLIMELKVDESANYETVKRINLAGASFREYGPGGELVSEGKADSVIYHTDTKNAEMRGHIEVVSHREKGGIRANTLYWDDARRFLSSSPDEQTEIFDEDGSRLSGKGFEADMKRIIVSFLKTVDGNYVTGDKDAGNLNPDGDANPPGSKP